MIPTVLLLLAALCAGAPVLCVSSAHVMLEAVDAHCCGSGAAGTQSGPQSPALSRPASPQGCGGCVDIPLLASDRREGDTAALRASISASMMPTGLPELSPAGPAARVSRDLLGPPPAFPGSMPLRC